MTKVVKGRARLRKWIAMLSIASVVVLTILGAGILLKAGWQGEIGALWAVALIFLFVASVAGALMTTEIIPWHDLSWSLLNDPKVLGAIVTIMMSAFGGLGGFVQLLQKQGGVETALGELKNALQGISRDAKAARNASERTNSALKHAGIIAGKALLIEQRINGVWGQADCTNTYRFTYSANGQARSLSVKSVISAPGLAPYDGLFTVRHMTDQFGNDGYARSTMVTEEEAGLSENYSTDFTLVSVGDPKRDRLEWKSKNPVQNPATMIRCQVPASEG